MFSREYIIEYIVCILLFWSVITLGALIGLALKHIETLPDSIKHPTYIILMGGAMSVIIVHTIHSIVRREYDE